MDFEKILRSALGGHERTGQTSCPEHSTKPDAQTEKFKDDFSGPFCKLREKMSIFTEVEGQSAVIRALILRDIIDALGEAQSVAEVEFRRLRKENPRIEAVL